LECVVFGKRAGEKIAAYVSDRPMPKLDESGYQTAAVAKIEALLNRKGAYRLYDLRTELQDVMTEHCGIFRDRESLTQGLAGIQRIAERYEHDLHVDDRSTTFNMDLIATLELRSLITVGEIIMKSAFQRQESRGAHSRSDYPQRHDEEWLCHSLGYLDRGTVQTSTRPVDLSLQALDRDRFTPQERKY
jgi:succinate dehydrogenase / fumarate reductase flavoprotein subunit